MRRLAWLVCPAVLLWAGPAWGFHASGHRLATEMAVGAAAGDPASPDRLPEFFAAGFKSIARCAPLPDYFRDRLAPQLRDAEYPEHYAQWPVLKDMELPPTRYEFIERCARKGLRPREIGTLPYAIAEWTGRLTLALAEHRKHPEDAAVQHKCLLYAGMLAHYAQDGCNPLHTTADYDGRALPDGSSPRSGIHFQVDALIGKVPVRRRPDGTPLAPGAIQPAVMPELMPSIFDQLRRSHALVEGVYDLEKELLGGAGRARTDPTLSGPFFLLDLVERTAMQGPPEDAPLPDDARIVTLARERLSACASFTASLYLTAWRDSAKVEVPAWLEVGAAAASGPAASAASRPAPDQPGRKPPATRPAPATTPPAKERPEPERESPVAH